MEEDTLALLTRLTDYAEHTESSIDKITLDVEKLREERYRPYITTMGAFLALFVAAVGYVYAMEQRLTNGFFEVQSSIHEVRAFERINQDRIKVISDRLDARSDTMARRWVVHLQTHEQQDAGREMMAKEILKLTKDSSVK